MVRLTLTLLFLSSFLVSGSFLSPAWGDDLTFKKRGEKVKTLSLEELKKKAPPHSLKVYEMHEEREVTYQALDLRKILDAAYGPGWRDNDEMLFTCLDGYQPSIPISKIRDNPTFLAVSREDSKEFTMVVKQEKNKKVENGPYYLIWDNLKNARLRAGELHDWPYQVITIDLIQFADKFPNISPAVGASPQVKRGFVAYRQNCFACHQINGEGGNKAPELNYPVNVTEYFKESYLKKFISNPSSVRANAQMPGLEGYVEKQPGTLTDILAYLKSMTKKKVKPAEKAPE